MADLASLVLRLSADVATLQNDLNRTNSIVARSAKQMEDVYTQAGQRIGDSLKGIAGQLAAAFTVDRLIEFGKQAIDTADQFNKMSQKVGISVETLSTLNTQAKLSDVSVDSLQTGLGKLAKNAAEAAGGGKQQAAAFAAIGISAKDAAYYTQHMDELLAVLSQKFAGYADDGRKTALAQQFLGKSGAELIPLLNDLGTKGFAVARAEAQKYGQVISTDTARQSEQFNDNLTRLQMAASGFANAVVREMLPGLVDITSKMDQAASTSDNYASSAKGVADVLIGTVELMRDLGNVASQIPDELTADAKAFDDFAKSITGSSNALSKFFGLVHVNEDTSKGLFSFPTGEGGLLPGVQATKDFFARINTADLGTGLGEKQQAAALKPLVDFDNTLKLTVADVAISGKAYDGLAQHIANVGIAAGKASAPIVDVSTNGEHMAEMLQKAEGDAAKFLTSLDAVGADKYTQALSKYNEELAKADDIYNRLKKSGASAAESADFLSDANKKAALGFDNIVQAMRNANDADAILSTAYARGESDLNNQIRLLGLDEQSRKADELATRLNIAALGDLKDFMGPLTQAQQDIIDKNNNLAKSFVATSDAIEKQKEVSQSFVSIWENATNSVTDAFSKWVVEGGSLMDSLVSTAKQVVEQIISQFAKLAIINPILNAIFGGSAGFSPLATFASFAGAGGAASGGSWNMGGPSGASSGGGGVTSLLSAGQTIWSGFQKGLDGLYASGGIGSSFLGDVTYGDFGNTFAPSAFTTGASVAGGVYAGYNRYQNSQGGLGGVAGGVTYGVGTYTAGIAGAAALSGGLSAGLAAIGPVGWAALALMAVDMLSGGKLFGTKGKFNFGEQAVTVGSSGASVTAGYDLKGQGALFSGSTHSWQSLPASQDAIDAANQFFAALKSGTEKFAEDLGTKMGDIVGGQFIATFDKKGNITKTQSIVNGVTYNDTEAQFQSREVAENAIKILDTFNSGLDKAIDKYRANADQLLAITQVLGAAQKGFNDGLKFLALGTDQSTTALLQLAETSGQLGETVDQTLQRIMQAQAQYDQFVGQFKTTKYVDDFEQALSNINVTMLANIKQANDLARAAGASGAAEADLARIHTYAAQQAAAALAQLESAAQSNAFGLGLTSIGSLDEVTNEINALQAKAGQGGAALHGLGAGITSMADAAKHAMDLLLGDLSPLNDQQKLQQGLAGLRAGTATAEQVLEIGRRLYGSTQPYDALYTTVQALSRGGAAAVATGGVGGTGAGGLTGAERDRLSDLLKQQQALQDIATQQRYEQLAQQVAEIASAKGQDWRTVLEKMGVNITQFETGLKMSDAQTGDYIGELQKQTDDNGDNTTNLIAALNRLTDALNGAPTSTAADPKAPGAPTGHSRRNLSQADGEAIGLGISRGLRGMSMRGGRAQTARNTARVV